MKAIVVVIITSAISVSGLCQSAPPAYPKYHRSELNQMIRTAHTSEEFENLSTYFEAKEQEFCKKAEDEKRELDRCLAMPYASSKYPTAADSARGLLQYYLVKTGEFAQRAKIYHLLATKASSTATPPAAAAK